MLRCVVAVAIAGLGCGERSAPEPAPAPDPIPVAVPARVDAVDLVTKYECHRCHDVPGVAAAPRDKHCVACHQQIHAGTFAAEPAVLARWQARITSLRWAPSLGSADRLRRTWIRDFLLAPHDLRPGLVAQMPRLSMPTGDAARLAAYLAPGDREPPLAAVAVDLVRGEALYRGLGCARCHRFTGAAVDDAAAHLAGRTHTTPLAAWALAPDLRHARARMTPAHLGAWITEPRGAMPRLGVTPEDAHQLAMFVATAPLVAAAPRRPVTRPPRLARKVTWGEVERRVFRRVCWHCHAVPDFARGDGGPGTTGGFGFPARELDLSSYEGISAGSLDDHGERRSVFSPLADGTPRLVAHLLARHAEQAGEVIDGIRGMPLGLPALPIEDIQVVDSWIEQGRPQ